MEKCKKRKCDGKLRNISPLMMGPTWKCLKCGTLYDKHEYIWNSEEMRNSKCYEIVKSI